MSDEVIIGGHDQAFFSTQSNKIAVSLQYLKKRNWIQSFYKLVLSFLMKVSIHVQSTQDRKLLILCNNLEKVSQLLLCSIVMQ